MGRKGKKRKGKKKKESYTLELPCGMVVKDTDFKKLEDFGNSHIQQCLVCQSKYKIPEEGPSGVADLESFCENEYIPSPSACRAPAGTGYTAWW